MLICASDIYMIVLHKTLFCQTSQVLWYECLCPPKNVYVEILIPNVVILEGETFERPSYCEKAPKNYMEGLT